MQDPESDKFPAYLQYKLFTSTAFLDLKPASRMILILFYYEIRFKEYGRSKKWVALNTDDIILPYAEIRERLGYTDKTIWTAIQDIMAHGFLSIKKYGGRAKKDFTIYRIMESWEGWLPGQTKFRSRPSGRVGFQKAALQSA